ncbi:MAG: 2-hydroxyacyl-CoA dehydratase subunit D [Candidatus Hodarchaeales archaeon]
MDDLSNLRDSFQIFTDLLNQNDYLDKAILYFTSDIPLEIVSASGLIPVRIPPNIKISSKRKNVDSIVQAFNCTKSRQMLDFMINSSYNFKGGIFSENFCDSLQNFFDLLKLNDGISDSFQSFRFLHPVNRGGIAETKYYFHEIKRLLNWLQDWTKKVNPSDLLKNINLYNKKRQLMRELSNFIAYKNNGILYSDYLTIKSGLDLLPVEKSVKELENIINTTEKNKLDENRNKDKSTTTRILISGGMFENIRFFEDIPALDNCVKADDLSFGSRNINVDIKLESSHSDNKNDLDSLLMQISKYYVIDKVPDAVNLYPNKRKEYLLNQIRKYQITGVIFINYSFCDPDTFESRKLSQILNKQGINSIIIQTDPQLSNIGQLTTRVEAFIETLGG